MTNFKSIEPCYIRKETDMERTALLQLVAELRTQKPLIRACIPPNPNGEVRKPKYERKTVECPDNEPFAQGISIGRTHHNFKKWNAEFPNVNYEILREFWKGNTYYIEYAMHLYYCGKTTKSLCIFNADGTINVKGQ